MDRFIAFSKNMIPYHYAINASIFMDEIEIKNKKMPVNVLGDFRVSIRPCELSNFAKFFGTTIKMDTGSAEYIGMMNYLTRSGASLTDIALMPEQTYQNIRSMMIGRAKVVKFIGILDICRQILLGKGPASNTLAYLLATLNNRVLKLQYYREANKRLAGLYLKYGCIPFDDMPFASNLIKHVPETSELYGCISVNGREHTADYGYVGLGPTDEAENVSEYLRAMEWAINDKSVTNIALAGPYGAGKSSIINTFLRKHPSIKYINISLAAFRENNQEEIDSEDGNFEKLLEEGILKQLFYKVHYSKIPQSRYRKLHKVSFGTSLLRVLFTLALVISFTFLLAPAKIEEAISAYSDTMSNLLGWNELEQIAFASGFGLIIIIILTSLFRWINTKWKSIEINVADKAVIKADEAGEALSLNKNMDEILYFFEETDYSLVVIEDLDRFDTPEGRVYFCCTG